MTTTQLTCSVRVPGEQGVQERDAVALSQFAQDFVCELHLTRGNRRAYAKKLNEMIALSHESTELIVLDGVRG